MYKTKICRVCGESFIPISGRQSDCNRDVERQCVICGKKFLAKCSIYDKRSTCSEECTKLYRKESIVSSYESKIRKCVLCGNEFHPKTNTQKYCKRMHEVNCVICGKEYIVDTRKQDFAKTCSIDCANRLRFKNGNPLKSKEVREKYLKKYEEETGYSHPMRNPDVVDKMKKTSMDRYGKTSFTKTDEYKIKTKETNNRKYGVDWHTQNKDVRNKITDSYYEHYGVDNPMKSRDVINKFQSNYKDKTGYISPLQNPNVRLKIEETNLKRYGNRNAIASDTVKNKIKQSMIERYGVDNAMKNETVQEKVRNTNLERYGHECYLGSEKNRKRLKEVMNKIYDTDFYSQTSVWKSSRMLDSSKVELWNKFCDNPEEFIISTYKDVKPSVDELSSRLGVSNSTLYYWVHKCGLQDKIQYVLSKMEEEVVSFIKSIDDNIQIVRHDRKSIQPYELDIYLPQYKIAIECNPTSTHNSSVPAFGNEKPIKYNYHMNKTNMCEYVGIFLFHIFGYEWTTKKDIIKSMIRNLLHKNKYKYYARNAKIRQIDNKTCDKFLSENHKNGSSNSPIRYGAFINDDLLAVMTFSKLRLTISKNNYSDDFENSYELVRFCSKLNTNFIGIADKMFKRFLSDYSPKFITSFSDRSHTRGGLYEKLGFIEITRSKPNYVWVDSRTDIAYHRMNAQKRNLKKFLKDESIDLSKSEREIMIEHGFLQVFDSGTITWMYEKI